MNRNKTLFAILLIFALLMGGAYLLYQKLGAGLGQDQLGAQQPGGTSSGSSQSAPEKIPAPDFTVYEEDGNAVKLSDFAGKPVVLNFWASWCNPCRQEMPDFNAKYLELGEEIQFMMINMTDGSRETVDVASGFIADQGYEFPVFYDKDGEAAMAYSAYALPTSYFIDAEGSVIARATGAITADDLQRGIDMISGG